MPLAAPGEQGAVSDCFTCFIEDEYGLGEVAPEVRTILDIGANLGFFSMAARSYFPAARIHAYEPNPRALAFATRNAATADFTLFGEAVGATAGSVSIEDTGDSNQARTIAASGNGAQVAKVALSTAVERLGGHVDLAKIDCEGAEWELFTVPRAWEGIRCLRMEYHLWGQHSFGDVESALHNLGFQITRHTPSGEWGLVWARNMRA